VKHWRILLLVGAFLVLAGLAVWRGRSIGNAQAAEIVRRALAAEGKIAYTATKLSQQPVNGRLVESVALVARRPPDLRRIHFVTAPLDGVTVWRNRNLTYRHDPKMGTLEIYDRSDRNPEDEGSKRKLVLSNYAPQMEGEETVAGRAAYRIRLAPRHAGDAWCRVWIDKQTHLRLGIEDYDGKDRLIRRTRIQEVTFEALGPDAFQPPAALLASARKTYSDEEQPKSVGHVSSVLGFQIKLPSYVPEGYRLKGAYTYPCECGCDKPAAQVRWTNGLNTISMFQCGHPCGKGAPCSFPTTPQSASVPVSLGEESFLFVGETSRANLEKMAQSLKSAASR
jgi:outer membrane lipoprotein-sorting protein